MPPNRRPGRRPADQPPDLCFYKPKGLACVYVNGKRRYLGPWGSAKAKAAYRELITAWEAQHRAKASRPIAAPRTVSELVDAFMGHAKVYYRHADGTETREVSAFKRCLQLLVDEHSERDPETIRFEHVRSMRDTWVAAGHERKYVNQQLGRVKTFFRWALEERYVSRDVVANVYDVPRLKRGRSLAPESEPVQAAALGDVLKAMRHLAPQLRMICMFVLRSGCRPGEACAAHADHFHAAGSVFAVDGISLLVPPGVMAFAPPHKTNWRAKTVVYAIGPKLRRRLAPLIAKGGYLFPTQRLDHWREDWFSKKIGAACAAAGVTWTPNMLRHAYLSRRQRKAGWERARQSVMHSSISTTEIYVSRDLKASAEDAARWD